MAGNLPPQRPTLQEQRGYFFGLPSWPKLVARSTSTPWTRRTIRNCPVPKHLGTVGRHPIVSPWNNSNNSDQGSLRARIIKVLTDSEIGWSAIDILRIGYSDDEHPRPVVLFISVDANSTTWERGHLVTTQCKEVLGDFGFFDIECEAKESSVWQFAPLVAHGIRDPFAREKTQMSDYLGTSIAAADHPDVEGTKGLYLGLDNAAGERQATVALTCRHVVLAASMDDGREYTCIQSHARPVAMVQPGDGTLDEMRRLFEAVESSMSRTSARVMASERIPASIKQEVLRQNLPTVEALEHLHPRILDLGDLSSRTFGHLYYAPPYALREGRWRMDWALLGLLPSQHERDLSALRNEVFISSGGSGMFQELFDGQPRLFDAVADALTLGPEGFILRLSGVIPEAELWTPLESSPRLVGTVGGSSGLRSGFANEAKSVTRTPHNGSVVVSDQWGILGSMARYSIHQRCFSQPGDSGACVWDMRGRVGGILTAGLGANLAPDVTYATPMAVLLRDLAARGFRAHIL